MGRRPAWGHLNLLGEYDFSEDKLQDSVGIKPPKLTNQTRSRFGEFGDRGSLHPRQLARILWDFTYLCWANPGVGNDFGTGVGLWAKEIRQAIDTPRSAPQTTDSLIDWTGNIGLRPFLRDVA